MKNVNMKKILIVLTIIGISLGFVACGGGLSSIAGGGSVISGIVSA